MDRYYLELKTLALLGDPQAQEKLIRFDSFRDDIPWTRFSDMHTGYEGQKTIWNYILIQAAKDPAIIIFKNLLNVNPEQRSCNCGICGPDFEIDEQRANLYRVTAHDRGCFWDSDHQQWLEKGEWSQVNPEKVKEFLEHFRHTADRGLPYGTLEEYLLSDPEPSVLIIFDHQIDDLERVAKLRPNYNKRF